MRPSSRATAGPGYAKTPTVFAPKLREAGVKEETVRGILVNNPRRFLTFVPKQRPCWAHAAAAFPGGSCSNRNKNA